MTYRLLTPWFADDLRGMPDQAKDAALARWSDEQFRRVAPLYRVEERGAAIQLHPDWWEYLHRNHTVVQDWARWNWLVYMQSRNPATLNVAGKLLPPLERAPLTSQRKFWTEYLKRQPLQCIYSGRPLRTVEALDHFLPWSFVLHDRWWNLVPVSAATNSAKRDSVPRLEPHLGRLVDVHADALLASRDWLGDKAWGSVALQYAEDLRVPVEALHGSGSQVRHVLDSGYRQVVPNLAALARLQGFSADWDLG